MNALDPAAQRQFDLALHHHQAGRLSEAEPLYRQVLAAGPDHADSLHLLGLLLHQTRRGGEGAEMIGRACALDPTNPTYLQNLGVVLRQSGRLAEAEVAYRALLALQPDSAVAHGYLANALRDQGKLKAAVDSYQRALQLAPDDAAAHHNLGVAQVRMGQLDAAIASYRRSLALRPDNAEALNDLGVAFSKNGARDAAIEQFRRAIAVRPDLAEAHAHLGALLVEAGASEAALPHYQQALALKPAYGEAAVGLSIVLCKLRRLTEALATCDQALARGEDDARLHHNRGVALRGLGRPKEALAAFDRVPIGDPGLALALANRGHALVELRRFAEAIASYDEVLQLDPEAPWVRGARLDCMLKLCRWDTVAEEIPAMMERLQHGKLQIEPLIMLRLVDDPALHRLAATVRADKLVRPTINRPQSRRSEGRIIRLGYFSPDFRDHPTSKLLFKLLEHHDRSRFHVTAFSIYDAHRGADRDRVAGAVDQFVEVGEMTAEATIQAARDQGVDIAIDLAAYTEHARTEVFAGRAAPIQVNFLGFPGTMGADFIDYIIADPVLIDASTVDSFAEKIVYLPDTYGVNAHSAMALDRPDAQTVRAEHGLPPDAFVFCCFNHTTKIMPEVFASWLNILAGAPDSRLWLMSSLEEAIGNLRGQAEAHGIDPARLIFTGGLPFEAHLRRYRAADLFLDTLPYNAHTTAADALWMGLPVLTRKGRAFAGRVAASFLAAVGLPELVTETVADYEALAIQLATDPDRHRSIRRRLEANRLTWPLFDTALYARRLEDAYAQMLARHRAGLAPDHIHVQP